MRRAVIWSVVAIGVCTAVGAAPAGAHDARGIGSRVLDYRFDRVLSTANGHLRIRNRRRGGGSDLVTCRLAVLNRNGRDISAGLAEFDTHDRVARGGSRKVRFSVSYDPNRGPPRRVRVRHCHTPGYLQ